MANGRCGPAVGKLVVSLLVLLHISSTSAFQSSSQWLANKFGLQPCAPLFSAVPKTQDYVDRSSYWVYMYYLLMVYREREGTVDVPFNHVEEGWQLGAWLSDQRALYHRKSLSSTYLERLEEAGVGWSLQGRNWEKMVALLAKYKAREGHVLVPQRHQEDGKNLGEWLNGQRTNQKNGKLSFTRQKKLEAMGVTWNPQSAKWEKMYALLVKFKQREGHVEVPFLHQEENRNLGCWLATQRKFLKQGALSMERQQQLLELGVDACVSRTEAWESMVQLLFDYSQREGHSNVPQDHKEQGRSLGLWLDHQRREKRAGNLGLAQRQQLDDLGISWDPRAEKWQKMYSILLEYYEREGNANVPHRHKESGENLGTWLSNQCQAMKRGSLSPEKHQQLAELGVHWSRHGSKWEHMCSLLAEFKEREGYVKVPRNHREAGENLGTWLNNQRQAMKNGSLPPEKHQQLEELGVQLSRSSRKWDHMASLLVQFKEREGHVKVPFRHQESDENLGIWLSNQCQAMKRGSLSPEKHQQLKELGVQLSRQSTKWEQMYALLVLFKNREGHVKVPRKHTEAGKKLGAWVANQRLRTKEGSERHRRLAELGVTLWEESKNQEG